MAGYSPIGHVSQEPSSTPQLVSTSPPPPPPSKLPPLLPAGPVGTSGGAELAGQERLKTRPRQRASPGSYCWAVLWGAEEDCYGGRRPLNLIVLTALLTVLSSLALASLEEQADADSRKVVRRQPASTCHTDSTPPLPPRTAHQPCTVPLPLPSGPLLQESPCRMGPWVRTQRASSECCRPHIASHRIAWHGRSPSTCSGCKPPTT